MQASVRRGALWMVDNINVTIYTVPTVVANIFASIVDFFWYYTTIIFFIHPPSLLSPSMFCIHRLFYIRQSLGHFHPVSVWKCQVNLQPDAGAYVGLSGGRLFHQGYVFILISKVIKYNQVTLYISFYIWQIIQKLLRFSPYPNKLSSLHSLLWTLHMVPWRWCIGVSNVSQNNLYTLIAYTS